MNPFLNPITGFPFLKHFIFDPKRLEKKNPQQIARYRDKAFRKLLKYAYTVPLYYKKYREAGIHLSDIKGIKDIIKLPYITKKDLVENFPDGIIPSNYNKEKGRDYFFGLLQ